MRFREMGFGFRLCFCVLFAFALMSSAAADRWGPVTGNENVLNTVRRSLKAIRLDDYSEPSANRGHDPRNGGGSGRRG